METMDDAGVYRLTDEIALVQTVDFFYPIVDDPRSFGRIAAANSMSDIWAMGARAITAMNHLAYPAGRIPQQAIEELLIGAAEKLMEAGVVLLGGHTLEQEDLVFGMSVTGLTNPGSVLTNDRARPGDILVLTKPIGTGVYCDAMLQGGLTPERYTVFVEQMERLNMYASEVMQRCRVTGLTDITGFGLLGHAMHIARNSRVLLSIEAGAVPLLPGLPELLEEFNPKGVCKCKEFVEPHLRIAEDLDSRYYTLFAEAQTSGGFLAAVDPADAGALVTTLRDNGDTYSTIVGCVRERDDDSVFIELV
jgi:selenide, water dikinase